MSEQNISNIIRAALTEKEHNEPKNDEPVISISTRTSRASFVYERMRNAVDYKEEHLIRRNAIERMLRRLITTHGRETLAENLIRELIHARYLPNNAIPQKRIAELTAILEKYFLLLGTIERTDFSKQKTLAGWMLGVMATEVDEFLMPPYVMHASINAMYEVVSKQIHIEEQLDHATLQQQLYVAVSRNLYKNDDDTLKYHLFLTFYHDWPHASAQRIGQIQDELAHTRAEINRILQHPIKEKLQTALRKHVAYFTILRELVVQNPHAAAEALPSPDAFDSLVKKSCARHYDSIRATLRRGIVRSVIYLLLTKFLLAIVLEIPIEYWTTRIIHVVPLLTNLFFPPLLLFIIARSTKLPDTENTKKIIEGINAIIAGTHDMIQVAKAKKRSVFMKLMFTIFYMILFGISFGLLIALLQYLGFTYIAIAIFMLFLSLVSLFAYRLRRNAQLLLIVRKQPGFLKSLFAFFAIPVLDFGKWLSTKFGKINIFIFVLDFVIEAPFKSFIKITEEWVDYVHQRKDEL